MIRMLLEKKSRKRISGVLLSIMVLELVCPTIAAALSSGPVQPEISSFEPVGTTDMVDLFTGDFVYNIPLMDVEGYPLNISYHGGVTMEQEASWVGLGWNINPGAINRSVRGLPDEFDGELILKELNIKTEITKKIGIGVGVEALGIGEPGINLSGNLGGYLNISNYRGVSVDFTASAGINTRLAMISAGMNVGASVGSQAGAAIDYGGNVGVGVSQAVSKDLSASGSFNMNYGGTYSPRTGLRRSVGYGMSLGMRQNGGGSASMSTGTSVAIGLQNYTAAVTNSSYMNSWGGQVKIGGELFGAYAFAKCAGSVMTIGYDADGSRKGYGYFNLANANTQTNTDLLDFSREKDGMYNTTMQLLPQSQLTYDVYTVSGQGTGGSFRPFRNDIGGIYDPYASSKQESENGSLEFGAGNAFETGGEYIHTRTTSESGPWSDYKRNFTKKRNPGYYEDIYFKEAGELTANNENYLNAYANGDVITPEDVAGLPAQKTGSDTRIVRSNHIYTLSGSDEDSALLLSGKQLISYKDTTGFKTYPIVNRDTIKRVTATGPKPLNRKTNHLTEIVQTQKDGRRYVYGLPVINNVQREATFAVDTASAENKADLAQYLVNYNAGVDDTKANTKGLDNFYSSTVTPTYVTAHLLTGVLSADYIDVTGNGISDDDLGTYTKFNYSRKSADYRWRSPVQSGKAQYMPGYKTDKKDDKAAYMIGSREQWMLHSVETKNYVAEFYVSPRQDAQGVLDRIVNRGPGTANYNQAPYNTTGDAASNRSYKLDSVVLYNKHDRFINGAKAQPIKTVLFTYDYSLCKNVPNATAGSGKLTLKKIQTRYGSSNLNLSAAYSFTYGGLNPDYGELNKDRWGVYKPNDPLFNNAEFPFTKQTDSTNYYAAAWSLTEIGLPSGGVIKVDYESDDYAYVQNKEAMEMFKIDGMGISADYTPDNRLFLMPGTPCLYFYFTRRTAAENGNLSFADNYLKGTDLLYYNIPVALTGNKYEPIKGYAQVFEVGPCPDNIHGYIKVAPKTLQGSSITANPVTYAALNVGRYNLPHILFPGSNPESSDIQNVVEGLGSAIKEMFRMGSNPLGNMIKEYKGQSADCSKSFMRLTSPGLKKKGGGQRVSSIRFYDNWTAMSKGNLAVYGKQYRYTLKRDDGKGEISSGVASYEPMIGGDELPQRLPVGYIAQTGNNFPPNDPVDLYQELPIGESFYPGPVVGYSNVSVTSINSAVGRSSQTEDIHGFYTAKDFPIQVQASPVNAPAPKKDITRTDITIEQQATQGFSLVLNDMHGKARNTEHWVLKPADTLRGKELINMQQYEYMTEGGQLSSLVPVFDYSGKAGKMSVAKHKMGIETDLTIDTRMRKENTLVKNFSFNTNGFLVPFGLMVVPWSYPFDFTNDITFRCATVTKVTQQYGILKKVTSSNEGAVTEVRNEVFDVNTGNALVTSVNNEFKDRVYNVSYPAYWAYKELGPSYQNHDLRGSFANPMLIDTLGSALRSRFTNYNPSFSTQYLLPANMPVARIQIDEEMPKFKLGDEMLVYTGQSVNPIKTWTMGYTSDTLHCYLVLATREPYKVDAIWSRGAVYSDVRYRVTRSGNKNRLGETIQSYTTTDSSNIFPYLKDSLNNVVSLNAQTYKHNLNQVYAANTVSDSLNPFLTGKVGTYRPELQLTNLKNRSYYGGTTRNAGIFSSPSYWKTERDNFSYYCQDSVICTQECVYNCPQSLDSLQLTYMGGDAMLVTIVPHASGSCNISDVTLNWLVPTYSQTSASFSDNNPHSFVLHCNRLLSPPVNDQFYLSYSNGCCYARFDLKFNGTDFTLDRVYYNDPPSTNLYVYSPSHTFKDAYTINTPFRIRKKILLGSVGHYDAADNTNWVKTQQVTKYNWFGQEIENKEEGTGYNSAVYGYNQQLPVCVAKNAKHSEVLFEGFEDYALLKPKPSLNASYMPLYYSPFESIFNSKNTLGSLYDTIVKAPGTVLSIATTEAHSGTYSLKVGSDFMTVMNAGGTGKADGYSFRIAAKHKNVISLWLRPVGTLPPLSTGYVPGVGIDISGVGYTLMPQSNIIDGWQKFEATFDVPESATTLNLYLKGGYYYDDIRIHPFEANSKGFVYHPVTRKLMATLDENNYATFYEYDAEGNLVRTKKETEKGILTITESRSTHRKTN